MLKYIFPQRKLVNSVNVVIGSVLVAGQTVSSGVTELTVSIFCLFGVWFFSGFFSLYLKNASSLWQRVFDGLMGLGLSYSVLMFGRSLNSMDISFSVTILAYILLFRAFPTLGAVFAILGNSVPTQNNEIEIHEDKK